MPSGLWNDMSRRWPLASTRSSTSRILTPGLRNASSRRRFSSVSKRNSVSGKICASGRNEMRVPVRFSVAADFASVSTSSSGFVTAPRENPMW